MVSLHNLSPQGQRFWFPHLVEGSFTITSEATESYNCIAWASGGSSRKWDPSLSDGRFWPKGLRRDFDLACFVELYRTQGYFSCDNGLFEEGFEKIALYVGDDNEVKHAARQLQSARWTSKLGDFEDIEHELEALEGGGYGTVKQFLKRPRKS
jgi:hypothetical protein